MEINDKDKLEINKALQLKKQEKYSEALTVLLSYQEKYKDHAGLNTIIGGIYFLIKDYGKSFKFLKHATILKPESEIASISLYHTLIHLGQDDQAIVEMKRYLSNYKPNDYKVTLEELFTEMDKNILTDKTKEMIIKYYNMYCKD